MSKIKTSTLIVSTLTSILLVLLAVFAPPSSASEKVTALESKPIGLHTLVVSRVCQEVSIDDAIKGYDTTLATKVHHYKKMTYRLHSEATAKGETYSHDEYIEVYHKVLDIMVADGEYRFESLPNVCDSLYGYHFK